MVAIKKMDKKVKKILIFSTAYFPFVGGAEVAVKEVTNRIEDIEFGMITAKMDRKLPKTELVGNVNVYRVGYGWGATDKFLLPICGLIKALKLQRKNSYDIVWPIMASQASIVAAFLKILKPKIKLILTLQEGDEEEHLKRYAFGSDLLYKIFIQPWHLLVFKKADFITAISNDLRQRALRNKIKRGVKVIPNGVDVDRFKIEDLGFKIEDFKHELGILENEKVVVTTSRLVKKNGINDLIRAISELRIKNQELRIKLLILGIGEEEKKLKKLVKDLKIEDKVMFLGQVPHNELPKYLWASDVFCRPSLSEGLGNSFLEAMAAGVPIVGTAVGGIPDFLFDPSASSGQATGWFCKVKNPSNIAEKINYILDDKNQEEVEQVVGNARKLIEKKYHWKFISKQFNSIFNKFTHQ